MAAKSNGRAPAEPAVAVAVAGVPDLSTLRLSQDYVAKAGVKKHLASVPVRKPDRQSFFRVRPGEDWRLDTAVLQLKEENEVYLIAPGLWGELLTESTHVTLFTCTTRAGTPFLWPIRLPGADGRLDSWSLSARDHAMAAMDGWVRMVANRESQSYERLAPIDKLPEPEWPEDLGFEDLVKLAFRNHFISSVDDPVVKKLRGGV